jgi:hypothetical protein
LVALLGRQPSHAQGCEAECAQVTCAGLTGQARGECQRSCAAQCACPAGFTFCPDDGLCYDLLTNNCHCGDPRLAPTTPQCGGQCAGSGLGHCCVAGVCETGGPSLCPRIGDPEYCTPGISQEAYRGATGDRRYCPHPRPYLSFPPTGRGPRAPRWTQPRLQQRFCVRCRLLVLPCAVGSQRGAIRPRASHGWSGAFPRGSPRWRSPV